MFNRKCGAVALFILGLVSLPARGDQKCVAASIDQVGKCFGKSAHVRRAVDRELRGINAPAAYSRFPFDVRLLATQIAGDFATGEVVPIPGGGHNDWMLLIHPAEPDNEGRLSASSREGGERLAWIRHLPAGSRAAVDDEPDDGRPVIEVKAIAAVSDLLPAQQVSSDTASERAFPDCVTPRGKKDEDYDAGGGYSNLGGNFRWLRLSPRHRVLVAEVSRTEGYAGGGGTFTGEVLLDVRNGTFVPIGCYAVSRYQMFGGAWNPDGTRQHPETHAAWRLAVVPGGEWPRLRLLPASPLTPGATLVWDETRDRYVEAQHQRERRP